jgi:hypothetical protein
MNRFEFLIWIVSKLNDVGSWSGNTHIQKIAELAQSISGKEFYKFVLYHYGPYSFDLNGDLNLLVSAGYLEKEIAEAGYHYRLTEKGTKMLNELQEASEQGKVLKVAEKVSELLGKAPTIVLELISTIDYFERKAKDDEELIANVRKVKPQFSEEIVKKALEWWKNKKTELAN